MVGPRRALLLAALLLGSLAQAQDVSGYRLEGPSDRFTLQSDPATRRGSRPAIVLRGKEADGQGAMVKSVKAQLYRGKKVRLTGWLRAEGASAAALFLRARDASGKALATEEMKDQVSGNAEWSQYTLTLAVPPEAQSVEYGAQLTGKGTVWVDNLQLVAVK